MPQIEERRNRGQEKGQRQRMSGSEEIARGRTSAEQRLHSSEVSESVARGDRQRKVMVEIKGKGRAMRKANDGDDFDRG